MKTLKIAATMAMTCFIASQAMANIVLPYQDNGWQYSTDDKQTWQTASAAFGSSGFYSGINTHWNIGSTLWLRHTVDLTGYDPSTAKYSLGIDNDLALYINDNLVLTAVHEGRAYPNDYNGTLNYATAGLNTITLKIVDRGGETFFDMQVTANPVPEPSTCIAGALLLLPFGVSVIRNRCKKQVA